MSETPSMAEVLAERDWARELGDHSTCLDAYSKVLARAEAAEAQVAAVRAARAGHPTCELHDDDDPISCGWKSVVLDIDAALDGEDS